MFLTSIRIVLTSKAHYMVALPTAHVFSPMGLNWDMLDFPLKLLYNFKEKSIFLFHFVK